MSGRLRYSAERHFQKIIYLMEEGEPEEALEELEKAEETSKLLLEDPENEFFQTNLQTNFINVLTLGNFLHNMGRFPQAQNFYELSFLISQKLLKTDPENVTYQSYVAMTLNNLGVLLSDMGRIEEAKQRYEKALEMREKLLNNDPENVGYQSDVGTTLNNLGNLLSDMGRIEEAKQRYEKALEMYEKLLKTDPENVGYQSYVGTTLNNLGILLSDMGRIEEAKQRYEKTLDIFTEPMQYLTIGRKSNSIIRLIELNTEQAEKGNQYDQMRFLKEAVELCKKYQDFFVKYELKHERELVTGAGLSAYIDFLLKNIRAETDAGKRAGEYEKAIKAVEKLKSVGEDEAISKICDSTSYYLSGRKLVNEALSSKQPDMERLNHAMEQFKKATETYEKANVCYCVYTGLFAVLKEIEKSEEVDVPKLKKVVEEVAKTLSDDVNPSICYSFKNLPQIFEEKDCKTRDKLLFDFLEKINSIEYRPLENLFEYIHRRTKDYFEEPFSPNVMYENWKLKVVFDDPEKVKGKLTIKAGNKTLLNRILTPEEIKSHILEIDYLERKYFPQGEDEITFNTPGQKKLVTRSIDYFESVGRNNKTRIFQCDCSNGVCSDRDLNIAVVQLKYNAYGENSVVKLKADDAYYQKVMLILDSVKDEADIVVFPEFSIPFEILKRIQEFADENEIIIIAGSHYVTEGQLGEYAELFSRGFEEEDLRKNISPVVIPSSRIVHNEKLLGAREERELYFNEGMKAGKVNHIFKLRDDLRLGLMICYEYLNADLRNRLIPACDVILVPQTNPKPERFYEIAKADIDNPCSGNKAFIMANGIFTLGEDEKVLGGYTGIVSTLDKYSYERQDEGIIKPIDKVMEQFVLLASINTEFNPARDTYAGQVPITTKLIHILEENEILSSSENEGRKFIQLLETIENCRDKEELKGILNSEENRATIKAFSPLMHKHIQDLKELTFDEMKKKCCSILIPAE